LKGLGNQIFGHPDKPGDWLTDYAFPFGRSFSGMFKQFNTNYSMQYSTNDKVITPIYPPRLGGNFPHPASVHHRYMPDEELLYLHTAPQFDYLCNMTVTNVLVTANPLFGKDDLRAVIAKNYQGPGFADKYKFGFYTTNDADQMQIIQARNDSANNWNHSGYWIMSVSPDIIPNHGNIFGPNVIALATALYRINQSKNFDP